ncbi:MAG: hypothetical protein K2Y08_05980 [Alphaproteobacteria bacterium]|nr:hypothetical protein [Alphaproteobacteria bacterium]
MTLLFRSLLLTAIAFPLPLTTLLASAKEEKGLSRTSKKRFTPVAKPLPHRKKGRVQVVNNLPAMEKPPIMQSVGNLILQTVKQHYDTDPLHNTYWTRPFFSADIMNVPAAALGDMLCVEFGKTELFAKKISELGILPSSPEDTTPSPVPTGAPN